MPPLTRESISSSEPREHAAADRPRRISPAPSSSPTAGAGGLRRTRSSAPSSSSDGEVLGEGFHAAYGGPHAEREALAACGGADTRGATLYVSLEPCCHHGQTPPCTDAILEAGIARVVVASDDPTEKAAGRGLGILRDEGVEVVVADGELAARARLLNQPFRKHARTGRPCVLFKSAMTLDGKVATRTGDSKWISGEASPRARAPLARRARRRRRRDRHRARRRPAADRARSTASRASRAASCSTPRRACRSTPSSCAARPRSRSPSSSRAPPRGSRPTRWRSPGADVIVATGENEPARVRSALDQLGAAGHHLDPARGRPAPGRARSSTPARSTRSGCSSRRSWSAARARATRSRARASSGSPRPPARSTLDVERIGDDVLDLRAAAGVVTCSPGSSRTSGRSTAVDARRRRRAARGAHAAAPARSPRATRSPSTASA